MTTRLIYAVRHLAEQFSVTADEFRRDNAPGGDMLLMGAVSKGYAIEQGGRYAVSLAGRRFLEAQEAPSDAEAQA
jgi:hypothetical protein